MNCEKCSNFDLDIYECEKNTAPLPNGKGVLFCLKFIKKVNEPDAKEFAYGLGFSVSREAETIG